MANRITWEFVFALFPEMGEWAAGEMEEAPYGDVDPGEWVSFLSEYTTAMGRAPMEDAFTLTLSNVGIATQHDGDEIVGEVRFAMPVTRWIEMGRPITVTAVGCDE